MRPTWTQEQRQRYNLLREREYAGALTDAEHTELAALMQLLRDDEAASLTAANERSRVRDTVLSIGALINPPGGRVSLSRSL